MEKMMYKLTNPQKNIWNTEMYFHDTTINNICGYGIIKEVMNFDKFKEAVNILVKENDSFRLRFKLVDGSPCQFVDEYVPFEIEIVDVHSDADFLNLLNFSASQKFSIFDDLLFRPILARFDNGFGALVLNVHHLISDSWAMGITIQEVVKIYHALVSGDFYVSDTFSYLDYISSENDYMSGSAFTRDSLFWSSYLNDIPVPVTLPSHINNYDNNSTGSRTEFYLDESIMNKVKNICDEFHVSYYVFFMSVISLFLANSADSNDILIGTPILNRSNFKEKRSTGMFISTVPFRTTLQLDMKFSDFLTANRVNLTSILRHQKYPYDCIMNDISNSQSKISNLYNVAVSYQITRAHTDEIGNYETGWHFNGNVANDVSIHLYDLNDTGSLKIDYDYAVNKYSKEDVNLWHLRIMNIIEQVISNPNSLLKDISFVTENEKNLMLTSRFENVLDFPTNSSIVDLFENAVNAHPDTTACVYNDVRLSYSVLNNRANQFARYLQELGIAKGSIVGVCMDKSDWFITSILAILKLGAAYLPMHPDYPEDRIKYILNDSNSSILISDKDFSALHDGIKSVNINEMNSNIFDFSTQNLNVEIEKDDLCYVIYTSGSTGKPKGVMLTHGNLVNFLFAFNDCFENKFDFNDVCLSVTNISFDVSVCEIFMPLVFGSTLVLYPHNTLTDIPLLFDILHNEKITYLYLPPNILNDVSDFIKLQGDSVFINKLLVGVEAIKKSDLHKFFDINPDMEIINGYGPTEATICSTFYKFKNDDSFDGVVPIGYPVKNNFILILNRFGNIMPTWYPGELCICGNNVSKGYLNNPEQNTKAFIDSFYHTGDIAYFDENLCLHFVGRNDSQVKLNGHRIELNEINNVIKSIDGVKNSITLINKINDNDFICSYIVIDNDNISTTDILQYLNDILPFYMVPTYIKFLEKLPLTANGKIDKKSLPEILIENKDFVEPTSETQIVMCDILCNILNLKKVSITDNFFELGLDSLHGIRFGLEIYTKLGVNVTITDLFKYKNISVLADFIDNCDVSNINDINIAEKLPSYPLSSGQSRIYYASKMAGSSLVYNIGGAIVIEKLLDIDKIRSAFDKIIEINSAFRTYFKIENSEVRQYVVDNCKIDIPCFYDESDSDDYIKNLVSNFPRVFDLDFAPLLRVHVHFVNNSTVILLDSHHIVLDGSSLIVLLDEFCKLYDGEIIEKKFIDYQDYTMWEKDLRNESSYMNCKNYWVNRYSDFEIPVLNLPYDFSPSHKKTYSGTRLSFNIDKKLFENLESISSKYQMSNYMVFLSAFYLLLYKYTGQQNLVIGSPIESRYSSKLKNIIGMFTNNMALNMKIDGNITLEKFLLNVKDSVLQGLKHQPYAYDDLTKDLNIPANSSVFDVVFVYQNQNDEAFSIDNMSANLIGTNNSTAKFPLTVDINPFSLEVGFEYNTDLFKESTIKSIFEHYMYFLNNLADNLDITLDNISSITDDEQLLLNSWNNTYGEINSDTFITLFEKQVSLNPNNVAVICDDVCMTYLELNQKANSLANYLVEIGVKPNDIVCIMTNRSLETICCMLGILKAGAAFLNVDPTYPIERTKYYLDDCKAKYLLYQKVLADRVDGIEHCIEIDLDNHIYTDYSTDNLSIKNKPFDLSYVIYTSGSTGTPKGVMLHQVGLCNMVKAMGLVLDYLKEGNKHCIASVTSTPFDIFVYEILVSLGYGLKVLMANNAEHRNPVLLDGLIKKYGADVMTVTPSLMKINYDNRLEDSALSNIKHMVFGGEPLPEKFVEDLRVLSPGVTIYNIYGPSEITVLCNVQNLNNEDRITIGPPIMNTQIHILDKNRHPVPIGVVGEIYISGVQVGLGYLGKPEMTDSKFTKNPFGDGMMYQSGDIGRWTFDGKVQCLGRIDNQIKLRGLRIELGEIENIMENIPYVICAVANKVVINDHEYLCGYYVSDNSNDVLETDVKEVLKKALPPYMVPSYIIKLDKMPYSINRKIDRKALPIPDVNDRRVSRVILHEKKTPLETKLWKIWKKVLHTNKISIFDNFFDIGGDSISAITMQIEALKVGFNFQYADIFNYPTIRDLASQEKRDINLDELTDYDYSKFNTILSANSMKNLDIKKVDVGNVLLIGVTGFLGAHIIRSFLENEFGDIYCLIRKKNHIIPTKRLENTLSYYFGEDFYDKYSERIHVIEGDISEENIALPTKSFELIKNNVTTVINSGALVKHFGDRALFEKVNVLGTQNVVNLCKSLNKRLIHISTISVSGNGEKEETIVETPENINDKVIFSEKDLYVHQHLNGVYSITKFKAERIVLEGILGGLDAQILRIGNISNRYSDGAFQRNTDENAFARRIQSFIKLRAFPEYALQHEIELTPVDLCADAVIRIAGFNSNACIFHIFDTKLLSLRFFVDTLSELNIDLTPVSDEQMSLLIEKLLNENKNDILSGIIHDLDSNKHLVYTSRIRLNSDFTEQYLNYIGFDWKPIDKNYIINYINYFRKIKFI